MFVQLAYAEAGGVSIQQIGQNIAPLAIIIVIFYFLVIRPQQKKLRNHHNMINNIQRGDQIITAGGIIGTVSKLEADTDTLLVEVAPQVRVKVKKETISQVIGPETQENTPKKEVATSGKKKQTKKKNAKN